MALGTTDITTTTVRNTIGGTSNNVSELVTFSTVNKWSKYKPVRGNWHTSENGKYGFNLPTNWDYLKPTGGETYPYRLGDFRGYEHNKTLAHSPIECRNTETTLKDLLPYNGTAGAEPFNVWWIRIFNAASSVMVNPSDLGYSSYYIGLKISIYAGSTYYKTYGLVSSYSSDKTPISVNAQIVGYTNPSSASFEDLPYGVGTYTWQLILCSSQATSWTTVQPNNVINFPADSFPDYNIISSGTFEVLNWIALSNSLLSFTGTESGVVDEKESRVFFAGGGTFNYIKSDSWIGVSVYDNANVNIVNNSASWYSGCWLHVYPTTTLSSGTRVGEISVSANGVNQYLKIRQVAAWTMGSVTTNVTGFTANSVSVSYNVNIATVSFTPTNLSGTSIPIYWYLIWNNGGTQVLIDYGEKLGRDNYSTQIQCESDTTVVPSNTSTVLYMADLPIFEYEQMK